MEKVTYRITLDTLKSGVQKVLQGFQKGDNYARKIEVTLVSGSTLFTLPSNVTAAMYLLKEGQTSPSINACEIVGNKIMYDVAQADIDTEGIVKVQLKVIETMPNGASKVLVSPQFEMCVWESITDDSEGTQNPTFTALEQALAEAKNAKDKTIKSVYVDDGETDPERQYLFVVEYYDGSEYTSTVLQDAILKIDDVERFTVEAKGYAERAEAAESTVTASAARVESAAIAVDSKATSILEKADIVILAASEARQSENNAKDSENNAALSALQALNAKAVAIEKAEEASISSSTASSKADDAYSSEQSASQSESNADAYKKLSQSYAVGGTGERAGEDTDNARYFLEQCRQIAGGLAGGFIPMGTIPFASLATVEKHSGWMYNISDEFTSDSRFKDGGGKTYAAGTNVYFTADEMWDCLSGSVPTVNGKTGNNITLDGRDLNITSYSKASSKQNLAATDTVNSALGKLEKRTELVENNYAQKTLKATTTALGLIKPDGKTITVADGVIKAEGVAPTMTMAEYEALADTKYNDDIFRVISDVNVMVAGGGGIINDTLQSTANVWSASKTNTELDAKASINSLKTINGQSIYGGGNIVVQGGGSGIGQQTITVSGGIVNESIEANQFYLFSGVCSQITIALASATGYAEYMFGFTSDSACVLTVPTAVKWDGGETPTIEGNKYYEVSILNNVAVISRGVEV